MARLSTKKLKYFHSHAFKNPKEHYCVVTFQVSNSCPSHKIIIKTKINVKHWCNVIIGKLETSKEKHALVPCS